MSSQYRRNDKNRLAKGKSSNYCLIYLQDKKLHVTVFNVHVYLSIWTNGVLRDYSLFNDEINEVAERKEGRSIF